MSKEDDFFFPRPAVKGVASEDVKRCSTCWWWETPYRNKWCKKHRVYTTRSGRTRTGTPSDHLCDEYTALRGAKCQECTYWTEENRPYAKQPCSKLHLIDPQGNRRSGSSPVCERFNQVSRFTELDNASLRIDGVLATVLRIDQHSQPQPFIIQSDDASGILVYWQPSGPGEGEWLVMPVEFVESDAEEGDFTLKQWSDVDQRDSEVLFAGKLLVHIEDSVRSAAGQPARHALRPKVGVSHVRIRPEPERMRKSEVKHDVRDTAKVASRVQDEPWGSAWVDLKEQVANLLSAGIGVAESVIAVQRAWSRETANTRKEDARRLQRQLLALFNRDET